MQKRTRIKISSILVLLCLVTGLFVWMTWADDAVIVSDIPIESERIPDVFSGFRIAHVSDLHNDDPGDGFATLLTLLKAENPDIIAVTGDLVDCRTPDMDISAAFMKQALQIAPVYYVTGNHEAALYADYPQFENRLIEMGIKVLNNEAITLTKQGESIVLLGFSDPNTEKLDESGRIAMMQSHSQNNYTVVLSHRPEIFREYVAGKADLVLTGHAHGGQFRLPFIGGLYSPGEGILPVYDAGLFTQNETMMYVSRGIGNSLFPIRFNNRPELPVYTLQSAKTAATVG